jgi:hypothetical protein
MTPTALMTPVEIQKWQFICDAIQNDAAIMARTLDAWNNFASPFLVGMCLAILIGAVISAMLAASYRPRIPRGGFFVPAFGLFGGTPKLYLHPKPSNLFGTPHKKHHHSHHSHSYRGATCL